MTDNDPLAAIALSACTPTSEFTCLLDHYARTRAYRPMLEACQSVLSTAPAHPEARFYKSFALLGGGEVSKLGNDTEAMRDLDNLLRDVHSAPEQGLAACALLLQAHKTQTKPDQVSIEKLKEQLKTLSKTSDVTTLLVAGRFFMHSGKYKQAKQCLDKLNQRANASHAQFAMQAFVYLCFIAESTESTSLFPAGNKPYIKIEQQRNQQKRLALLERLVQTPLYDLNALHCHASILMKQNRFAEALNTLNIMQVQHSEYLPALIEKSQVLLLLNNFDEALVISFKILKNNQNNIFALFTILLCFLSKEGAQSMSIKERFLDLQNALEKSEGNHFHWYYYFGTILARMSQGSRNVLNFSLALLNTAHEKAKLQKFTESAPVLLELAAVHEALGDQALAQSMFTAASKAEGADGAEVSGLLGLVRAKLLAKKGREAAQELDLIQELVENHSNHTMKHLNHLNLTLLRAKIAFEYENDSSAALQFINDFFELYSSFFLAASYSSAYDFYFHLPSDLLISAIRFYVSLTSGEPRHISESEPACLNISLKLLASLVERVPGFMHAHLLRAKLLYLNNKLTEAEEICVVTCQTLDANEAAVYVLLAHIHYVLENYKTCSQNLEQARSLDFEVRNTIDYHLLKARLFRINGQMEEAKQVAQAALEICGGNTFNGKDKRASGTKQITTLATSRQNRLLVTIELIQCLASLGQFSDADRIIAQAKIDLNTAAEQSRLSLSIVDLAIAKKDIEHALGVLRGISADSPLFSRAKLKMADIYLHHKHNRKAYLSCYQDLLTVDPSLEHQLLVAEAYMSVQEPELAITMYENALQNGGDVEIYSRIGKAMIATHDYNRACDYYEHAVNVSRDLQSKGQSDKILLSSLLLHELASLLCKMRRYDDAISILQRALQSITEIEKSLQNSAVAVSMLHLLQLRVDCLLLDAEIMQETGQPSEKQLAALNASVEAQNSLLQYIETRSTNQAGKTSSAIQQAKELAANLYSKLGFHYQKMGVEGNDQAILYFHEALKHAPAHEASLYALSRLHYSAGQFEEAKTQLVALLRVNASHSAAQLFLADIHYEMSNFEHCIYHLQALMENQELHHLRFEACCKVIIILRRHGRLLDGARVLKQCEKAVITGAKLVGDKKIADLESSTNNKTATVGSDGSEDTTLFLTAPGLHFCKGLYYYYLNHPRSALFHFNLARKSHDWGDRALFFMIEIYLNPDHLELFSDVAAENDTGTNDSARQVSLSNNLKYARTLLCELQTHENASKQLKYQILENYVLLSSKNKVETERAISSCMAMLTVDANYVPGLLCLANAYHILQQPAKTRNYLKRVSKMKLNREFLLEFEKSYLFLAEIYLQIGKFELSTELCKKTLSLNKSNGKAWEILGGIMEKEASYRDASDNYEQAWYNCGQSDVNIGFKLAFNYLKCKKYVEAIDVCHATLKLNADQPKLKKEILEKARLNLRP